MEERLVSVDDKLCRIVVTSCDFVTKLKTVLWLAPSADQLSFGVVVADT